MMASKNHRGTENGAREEEEEILSQNIGGSQDEVFDLTVSHLQEIVISDEFMELQHGFMEKHYEHFEDVEENKLIYTDIFKEYTKLLEKYIEVQLELRIPKFDMNKFLKMLESRRNEIPEEIFEMLLSFTDFLTFKQMFLDYKADKNGCIPNLDGIICSLSLEGTAT